MNRKMNLVVLEEHLVNEWRVAMTPDGCRDAKKYATVWVEAGAGVQSGYSDDDYRAAGARVLSVSELIPLLSLADTVVLKVKQPIAADRAWFDHASDCTIFAYFHSTGESERTTIDLLLKNRITAISYENITADNGKRPLLIPMSRIAGRRAVEIGMDLSRIARAKFRVSEKPDAHIQMVIVGGGTVGVSALEEGLRRKLGKITVFEERPIRAADVAGQFKDAECVTVFSSSDARYDMAKARDIPVADLVIGAAYVSGGHSPMAVTLSDVESMGKGSVIVDVSIDQGGCIERPPNAEGNVFEYNGVTFCCIPNLPGSVPKESTPALAGAILPYLLDVLQNGMKQALKNHSGLCDGLLTYGGKMTDKQAAEYWDEDYVNPQIVLKSVQ